MTTKTNSGVVALCSCAVALTSCTYSQPPQTGFYCVDIPQGKSAEAGRFVRIVANRLDFKVSEAEFPGIMDHGPANHMWEVYGRGVSMFVGRAMLDGKDPDRYGNITTTFNPNRLDINVSKDSFWQRISFKDVLSATRDTARELGWSFSKAKSGESCAT